MMADEYLKNLRELEYKYNQKAGIYNLQYENATRCTTSYSTQPKAPQRDPFAQEKRLVKLNEMKKDVDALYYQVEAMRDELESLLRDFTNSDAMAVIHYKYITHLTISSIEAEIHCSRSTVYRLLDKGYAELDRILADRGIA